jgi:hypothetical protein
VGIIPDWFFMKYILVIQIELNSERGTAELVYSVPLV